MSTRASSLIVLVGGALVAAALVAPRASSVEGRRVAGCHEVKLISVRGSGDTSSNMGKLGAPISNALQRRARARGVDYDKYGLPYPAVGINWWKLVSPGFLLTQYTLSKNRGRDNLRAFVKAQCTRERIVMVGFSQGAHVIGDVLSRNVGGLTTAERSRIKAVLLVADPRFNSREPFDAGSFTRGRNGLLGARSPGDLREVSGRTQAWCRNRDLVCQGLLNARGGVHNEAGYIDLYGQRMVDFIASKLGWNLPPPPPGPPPPQPPPPPPPPPPGRVVTLARGPPAPSGYRYAITLDNFPANRGVTVTCHDSVDPGGFYTFILTTNGSGHAFTQSQCYSGDGPDHWVFADGVESNHVVW